VNDFKFFSQKKILLLVIAFLSAMVLIDFLLTPSPLRLQLVRATKGSLSMR